jgi:hypothetical protein
VRACVTCGGNGSYPPTAIRRFTGVFEGDRLHGSLQIIGKMKDMLMGRAIGILITDGSDGAIIKRIKNAAIDFVRDAFGHLKAIAVDQDVFIAVAKVRRWDREKSVRTLA